MLGWNNLRFLCLVVCIVIPLFITSCTVPPDSYAKNPPPPESSSVPYPDVYNQILALILESPEKDGRYSVVSPNTSIGIGDMYESDSSRESLCNMITILADNETVDLTPLVNQWFELNKKYERLTLESSVQDGYYIDYDGKFANYFKSGTDRGWRKWERENPNSTCHINISIPAYDPQTGYVIVYKGVQCAPLIGGGGIWLYKYADGKLEIINHFNSWIS